MSRSEHPGFINGPEFLKIDPNSRHACLRVGCKWFYKLLSFKNYFQSSKYKNKKVMQSFFAFLSLLSPFFSLSYHSERLRDQEPIFWSRFTKVFKPPFSKLSARYTVV